MVFVSRCPMIVAELREEGLVGHLLRMLSAPGVLLAGSLLLAMGLGSWLLLRYTRLGRAHLITKCAVLSLLAHVLFGIYAWRTLIARPEGVGGSGPPIQVRLVEQAGEETALSEPPSQLPVWEQFSTMESLPDIDPLEQPVVETEIEIQRIFENPAEREPAEALALEAEPEEWTPPLPELKSTDQSVPDLLPVPPLAERSLVEPEKVRAPEDAVEVVTAELDSASGSDDSASASSSEVASTESEAEEAAVTATDGNQVGPDLKAEASPIENTPTENSPAEGEPTGSESMAGAAAMDLQALPPPPPGLPLNQLLEPRVEENAEKLAETKGVPSGAVPAELAGFTQPPRINPPRAMPGEYSERAPERRAAALAARGGSVETEQAVQAGLAWLAAQQRPDGRWDPRLTGGGLERLELGQDRRGAGLRSDNGITGLALLAFLGAGHTQESGAYRDTVARGLGFLLQTQTADGFLGGQALNFERTYCHGMALLALAEALAMTGDERLKLPVQRAVAYTVAAQSRQDGGWRYQPGESGDMSQFGWQVLALRSAELGGVPTPLATREGMRRFINLSTRGPFRGLGCYRPGEGASPTMTAEALLCRQLLEQHQVDPRTLDEASGYLMQSLPAATNVNEYYWYYGTLALYHVGGKAWERWNEELKQVLLARQIQRGADAGAWPADGMWAGYGGKVFSTALSTLSLEVYYRYSPLHEQR